MIEGGWALKVSGGPELEPYSAVILRHVGRLLNFSDGFPCVKRGW